MLLQSFRPLARLDRTVSPEIYTPLGYDLKQPNACRGCQHLQLFGRLKRGVSIVQAGTELNTLMQQIVREHPKDYDPQTVIAMAPLRDYIVGKVRTALLVVLGAWRWCCASPAPTSRISRWRVPVRA